MNSDNLHILIAEDEASHAVILRRRLEKEFPAAAIEVVSSIRDYRKSIAASSPSIVLLDLNLVDGCTIDLVAEASALAAFPLIMMSSYTSREVSDKAMLNGAIDFIIKSPEVFMAITEIVDRALQQWNRREQ